MAAFRHGEDVLKLNNRMIRITSLPALLLGLLALAVPAAAQTFTLQIGAAPLPPAALVNHGDTWRYRPARTHAPQVDWRSAAEATLDGTWLSGPDNNPWLKTIVSIASCLP